MAATGSAGKISVDTEHPEYTAALPKWKRIRAILAGQDAAKKHDSILDTITFSNLLVPFSPKMSQAQYNFYLAEAELPGISSQFYKILIGSLLKTAPDLGLPDSVSEEGKDWLQHQFGQDNSSFQLFLKEALEEELATSRAWVFVDRPKVTNPSEKDTIELQKLRPFPVLWKAEEIINWTEALSVDGYKTLTQVILKQFKETTNPDDEFKKDVTEVYVVHELDASGFYQVRIFEKEKNGEWKINIFTEILYNNVRLEFIPAWPLNGQISVQEPALNTFVNKEISLYNKTTRRNHLLYGAATFTPYLATNMGAEAFDEIVNQGLGTWFKINHEDKVGILETPTDALQDYDRAILAGMDEMARLGIRLLTPEVAQSGVALEIRNAAQTSQIGFLGQLLNIMFSRIFAFMLNWRYNLGITEKDIALKVNVNFAQQAATVQWAELVTAWYENGLIPRSLWLSVIKTSEILPADYDDARGQEEITDGGNNLGESVLVTPEQDNEALDKLLNKSKVK